MPHFIAHLPPHNPFSLPSAFKALQLLRFQTVNRDRSLTMSDMYKHYGMDEEQAADLELAARSYHAISPVLREEDRLERDRQLEREVDDLDYQLSQIAEERQSLVEKGKIQLAKLSAELTSTSLDKHRERERALRHELDLLDAMAADLMRRMEECQDGIGAKPLLGVDEFLDKLIVCLMIQRNAVLEGSPGLAKTSIIKTLADMLGLAFNRIQFTPDLAAQSFGGRTEEETSTHGGTRNFWRPGPVFTNLLLCDEMNRAPPQVQNALIEIAEERQITLPGGDGGSRLLRPLSPVNEARLVVEHTGYFGEPPAAGPNDKGLQCFVALSTMNNLDSEGTFEVGDAVYDRFAFKLKLSYPGHAELTKLAEHAFEAESASPARRMERPSSRSRAEEKKPLMARQLHKAREEDSEQEPLIKEPGRTATKMQTPIRKAIRAERATSVVIDNSVVQLADLDENDTDAELNSDLSEKIRQRFSPDVPLPYSPLPDPPRATFRENLDDLGKALEIGRRNRGQADDENKIPFYRSQREEQEHVRTLYFLRRLRKMILGPDLLQAWNSSDNTDLRDRVALLIDFTHLRPYDWETRPHPADVAPSAKDVELKALLDKWRQNPGNFPKHNGYAELLQSLLDEQEYPLVTRGSSPRGLISLVRAIHAAALLRHGSARPNWNDVIWIAVDCLRHRIHICETSDRPPINPDNLIQALIACLE